jgi:outer membrane protein assembly factor BamB
MLPRQALRATLALNLVLLFPGLALLSRGSWPAQPAQTPGRLHLQWERQLPPLKPAWPDQPRFTSDAAYRPVAAGDVVLIASSRTDSLVALEAATGERRWQFTANGPVRFAPAVWRNRAYVASDDGYLYCLDVATGREVWKFRGGPGDRRILGNERLISTWPARGGPAVAVDGTGATVYFAAGIWPFMGIFLHALDARTGAVRWTNSGDGSTFIKQPHNADAFAGLAPQGSIVVVGDWLLVPGGRSVPACYDRHTGSRLHYRLAETSKLGGGPDVYLAGDVYICGGGAFSLATGEYLGPVAEPVAAAGELLYSASATACRAFDLSARPPKPPPPKKADKKARRKPITEAWMGKPAASVAVSRTTALVRAGNRLFAGGEGVVFALELPLAKERSTIAWRAAIDGTVANLTFADETLYVSTRQGRLYAFGPPPVAHAPGSPRVHELETTPLPPARTAGADLARRILSATDVRDGYCVVWGAGDGHLISELLRESELRLIVIEPDVRLAKPLRDRLHQAGLEG